MKLPNGFGTVYKLQGSRRKPYVVKKTIYPTVNEMMRGIYESRKVEEQKEKQVIVEVSNIRQSKERRGYIEWQTGWADAYRVILNDMQ